MKNKYIYLAVTVMFSLSSANAVTVTLAGITNSTVGFITEGLSDTLLTGTARFYSTSVDLSPDDVTGILGTADPIASFESLIVGGIATSPGLVRTTGFASGALTSVGPQEMGDIANYTYLVLFTDDSSAIGVYQGQLVPGGGAVTFNPNTISEDLIGSSAPELVNTTNSGFQLVQNTVIPEPSALLLSALGALGLLRRKR